MSVKICFLLLCISSVSAYEDVNLVEYINAHDYIFFRSLVEQAGLKQVLSSTEQGERIHAPHVAFTGPYTVFAPSDFAFAKIGEDALNHYSSSQLSSIIKYHIVDGYILSAMAGTARNYSTLLGETVSIGLNRGVSGQSVVVNGAVYVDSSKADNIVNNGVIQPIDTVLMPPDIYLTAETLAQILILDDDKFKDILLAFMLANMINLLESNDFTVFAPTDSAFAVHAGQMLNPQAPNAQHIYQEVLKYHIVPGARRVQDLVDGSKLYTLHGTPITITRSDTEVMVNNATITDADIFASNGFIHGISQVLLPDDIRPPRD